MGKPLLTISFAIVLAPMICSAGDAISLDQLVAEALARNPEVNVYSAEIAAAKIETGQWLQPAS